MSKEKKSLSAKRYLSQLEIIDMQINQDIERLAEMKEDVMSTGGIDYSRDRVQTSKVGDRLCSDVARYTDLDERLNAEIDGYVDAKEQIIREIRELRDVNYIQVLYKVYVQFKSVKVAAQEMKKSYRYVIQVHNQALKAFEETYPNLHYLT